MTVVSRAGWAALVFLLGACASNPKPAPVAPAPIVSEPPEETAAPPIGQRQFPRGESVASPNQAEFDAYLQEARDRILAQGIQPATYDGALTGVRLNLRVIELAGVAPERLGQVWTYLARRTGADRIARGQEAMAQNRALLDAVAARFGVSPYAIASIWGNETSYGGFLGDFDVIEAVATLAYEGRRRAFFENELFSALKLLEMGLPRASLRGSYAGAFGQVQFMPSSYLAEAVSFSGRGAPDIRNSLPDAFASAANYLKSHGWRAGEPWLAEVVLPRGFDYASADMEIKKPVSAWAALGVVAVDGRAVTALGAAADAEASIILPGSWRGAAFIAFPNYRRFLDYNNSQLYAMAVGHLANRLAGGGPIRAGWPVDQAALRVDDLKEIQRLLAAHGFDLEPDGRLGPKTRAAIRAYQQSQGLVPDGYANYPLLNHLRATPVS